MNRRILVIDDESTFRMFLRDIFESKGWQVTAASNGTDGLRLASAQRYDAIITDMVLPGLGGAELIGELRKKGLNTPIIAITGYSDELANLETARKNNVDGIVYKPFIAAEVYAAVDKAMRNSGGANGLG